MKRLILGLVVVLFGVGQVEGAIIVGHFHGTINDSRVWENTFGLPEGIDTINGMEISGNIAYDTALAPSDSNPRDPWYGIYQTVDDSVTWMQLNPVTIGGTLITIPPFPDPIVERDADQMFRVIVVDGIVQYTRDLDYFGGGEYVDYSVDLQWVGGSLPDDSLPLSLDLADFTSGRGYFYMDDHAGPRVAVGFDLDTLSVSPIVPEPSTLALLAIGAFGLLAYGWRRRNIR